MAKPPQFSSPIVRRAAGLQPDEACRDLGEELKHLASAQALPDDDIPCRGNTVKLKDRLCDIQSDRNCWFHGSPPVVASVTGLIGAALFGIVYRGSTVIENQKRALQARIGEVQRISEESRQLRVRAERASSKLTELNESFLRRISAALHDGPAQLVGLAALRLNSIGKARRKEDRLRELQIMDEALGEAIRDIRNICNGLSLPDIEGASIGRTIERVVATHEMRTGTVVDRRFDLDQQVPHPVEICVFRFVQEGLNNAYRHAGGIGQAVEASIEREVLTVRVPPDLIGINVHGSQTCTLKRWSAWTNGRQASVDAARKLHSEETSLDTEVELKLVCDYAHLEPIATCPALTRHRVGDPQILELASVYYDTPEQTLRGAGVALRVRFDGASFLMTAKAKRSDDAMLLIRTERSVAVKTFELEPSALAEILPEAAVLVLADRPLAPVFRTEIRRQKSVLAMLDSVVEVAIDQVRIVAGEKTEDLSEVELELKEGTPRGLFELAQQLVQNFPLRPSLRSKSSRGFDLVAGARPRIVSAPKMLFVGDETVEDVLCATLSSTIYCMLENQPAAEDGFDIEGLHQYRVALRRLRSLLGLMRSLVLSPALDDLRDRAKKLMHELGGARDWDVFIHATLPGAFEACSEVGGLELLERAAADMQHEARERARSTIMHSDNARFQIATSQWIQQKPWREDYGKAALMDLPAREFAVQILDKLHSRVTKRGRHLARLSAEQRHRLRIAVKRMRYAADFFLPLFKEDKAIRRYAKALCELQDQLGVFNDAAVTSRLVQSLGPKRMKAAGERAAGAVVGWQLCSLDRQAVPLMNAWHTFRDLDLPV